MRKRLIFLVATLVLCCALAGGSGLVSVARADGTNALLSDTALQTYGLYVSEALVSARNGKKMTPVNATDAVIKCMDGDGDGSTDVNRKVVSNGGSSGYYFATSSDSAYTYNAGIIGETSAGTTQYQTYGNSEIYYENYPGGVQRGGEWTLADAIDTSVYTAFSLEIACGSNSIPTGDVEGDAYIYVMGKDAEGQDTIINQKILFGVNYWSTGVIEWGDRLVSVNRIAVSVLWGSIGQQSSTSIRLTGFTVHAAPKANQDVSLTADDAALDFYNGSELTGGIKYGNGTAVGVKVFHSNTGYAGTFGVTGGAYCYGTQRITTDRFVTLRLKDPIKAADYTYLNIDLQVKPQIADGQWLAEDAEKFYIDVYNGNTVSAEKIQPAMRITLRGKKWITCQIPTEKLKGADGYVTKVVFCYAGNDKNREPTEESSYSIQLGILDACFTNTEKSYANSQTVAYYIEAPEIGADTVTMQLKMSEEFLFDAKTDDAFADAITINGKAPVSVTVIPTESYITVIADKADFAFDDTDKVEIAANVAVCQGLTTKEKETFVYNHTLGRFELQPAEDASREGQVAVEVVEMGTVDEPNTMGGQSVTENTIFITFAAQVCFNVQSGNLEAALPNVAPEMEDYAYELAKNGVIASVMDKLYVNDKSIREWLVMDKEDGKEGLIRVTIFGTNYGNGKAMRIMAATDSNLKLGVGKDMQVEFKEGFTTPRGYYIGKDIMYKIAAADANGVNSRFTLVDNSESGITEPDDEYKDDLPPSVAEKEKDKGGGCSGNVQSMAVYTGIVALVLLTGTLVTLAARRKSRKGEHSK